MASDFDRSLPHIRITRTPNEERFQPKGGRGKKLIFPSRNPITHGQRLRKAIEEAQEYEKELTHVREEAGFDRNVGLNLRFVTRQGTDTKIFEDQRSGIKVLNSKESEDYLIVVVFVPTGHLNIFLKKIDQYIKEFGKETSNNLETTEKSAFARLTEEIRLAAVDELWTDRSPRPELGVEFWWEFWIRRGGKYDNPELFIETAHDFGIVLKEEILEFPDRIVVIGQATLAEISRSVEMLNLLAELRAARPTAATYLDQPREDEMSLVDSLIARTKFASDNAPSVCWFDTGITKEHPLLAPAVAKNGVDAYKRDWGTGDDILRPHGTSMAGLSLYGDLVPLFNSTSPVELDHQVESIKILPPTGFGVNEPELYGAITESCVARAEINRPDLKRIIAMAVTAGYDRQGRPTSWSAAVDKICYGESDSESRLLLVSAGNLELLSNLEYPSANELSSIEDPSQSLNAVTVGACTQLGQIPANSIYSEHKPVAPSGGLSPKSRTSQSWGSSILKNGAEVADSGWALKPDIVMEGGNAAVPKDGEMPSIIDPLALLTTHAKPMTELLTITHDTSAATALAARLAGRLTSSYQDYRAETIRALMIHWADWTETMKSELPQKEYIPRGHYQHLIRKYGHGIPNEKACLSSKANRACLIYEGVIRPCHETRKPDKSTVIKLGNLQLIELPWPQEEFIYEHTTVSAEMRVTLSYFIEPSPGERGYNSRYRYASHTLRFEVNRPQESQDDFRTRINRLAQAPEETTKSRRDDRWLLGANLRKHGTIAHDRLTCSLSDVATTRWLAVFPVTGWWKERKHLARYNNTANYSVVVSVHTKEEIDLYTPIANEVGIPISGDATP